MMVASHPGLKRALLVAVLALGACSPESDRAESARRSVERARLQAALEHYYYERAVLASCEVAEPIGGSDKQAVDWARKRVADLLARARSTQATDAGWVLAAARPRPVRLVCPLGNELQVRAYLQAAEGLTAVLERSL